MLHEEELLRSDIIANNRMNRQRQAKGVNSYAQELKFDIATYLSDCRRTKGNAYWVDLCCGEGRALLQIARHFEQDAEGIFLEGVDLVDFYHPDLAAYPQVQLHTSALLQWTPENKYDLITMVHGLHYLGDKLAVIAKALAALAPDGLFIASFDPKDLQIEGQDTLKFLRKLGLAYDARKYLLSRKGPLLLNLDLEYLGADDKIGKNYSGQEVVRSYYRRKK